MTALFCLFFPSGIWGVIEITYQLMRADGLIKRNRKAFAAVPDSGWGGPWEVPARCVLAPLRGLLLGPQVPVYRVACLVTQGLDSEAAASCSLSQSSRGRSPLVL